MGVLCGFNGELPSTASDIDDDRIRVLGLLGFLTLGFLTGKIPGEREREFLREEVG